MEALYHNRPLCRLALSPTQVFCTHMHTRIHTHTHTHTQTHRHTHTHIHTHTHVFGMYANSEFPQQSHWSMCMTEFVCVCAWQSAISQVGVCVCVCVCVCVRWAEHT